MSLTAIPRRSHAVMNIGHFLAQTAARLPDRPALVRGDTTRSWQEMNSRTDAIAHALKASGIGKGARVLIHSDNQMDMAEAMYAIFKTGAVLVPTNFRLGPKEIANMGKAAGATAFVGNAAYPEHVAALQEAGIGRQRAIIIGGDYDAVVEEHSGKGAFRAVRVEHDDPCWFFFTSGTTGTPKIAVLSHGQMAFVINNHAADLMPGLNDRDASLVIAPLSHGAGLHFFIQVACGAKSVLLSGNGLVPKDVFQLIEKHRITNMFTVPTIVKRLVEDAAAAQHDHTSLRHVIYAGAPMYRADQKRALQALGPVLVQYYGLGEVTGAITVLPADEHALDDALMRVGTCGRARMGMEIAIVDENGQRLQPGQTGNIAVQGPAVCSAYLDNEAANAEAFVDGWFVTGDIGHMDDAGYLFITGRRSDMYISGGSNIYPRETEEVLLEHPAIAEVAIVGIPDEKWGETGAAVIVLEQGHTLQEADLRTWIGERVVRYKQPSLIVFVGELPKSGYGKIEKRRVRAMLDEMGLVGGAL